MPFIGKQPQAGAYSKLDAITTSATATYNLTLGGSAYFPSSANHLLVSLNGVLQAPQDSFTVSGSQITFASALTSADSIDFIMALGDVLDIGTPSAGATVPGAFNVQDNFAVDTNTFVVDATNNRVGIGESSPSHLLELQLPAATNGPMIKMSRAAGSYDMFIGVTSDSDMAIYDNSETERLRFMNQGGISFDGGSNYLDDYEEGTWTPEFANGTGGFGGTALNTITNNNYTKIGNKVYITADFKITGGSGISVDDYLVLTAACLPFTPAQPNQLLGVSTTNQSIATGSASYHIIGGASTGVTVITCANIRGTTSAAQTNFTHMSITYITNS